MNDAISLIEDLAEAFEAHGRTSCSVDDLTLLAAALCKATDAIRSIPLSEWPAPGRDVYFSGSLVEADLPCESMRECVALQRLADALH